MKYYIFTLAILFSFVSYGQNTFCDGWNSAVNSEGFGGTSKFPCISELYCPEPEAPFTCGFKAALMAINEYNNQKSDDDVIRELNVKVNKQNYNSNSWELNDELLEYDSHKDISPETPVNSNIIIPSLTFGSDLIRSLSPEQKEAIRKHNSERVNTRARYFKDRSNSEARWHNNNNRLFILEVDFVPFKNDAIPDSTRWEFIRLQSLYSVGILYRFKSYLYFGLGAEYQQRYFKHGPSFSFALMPTAKLQYEKRWNKQFLDVEFKGSLPSYESPFGWVAGNFRDFKTYYIGDVNGSIKYGYLFYHPHSIHIKLGVNALYFQSPITGSASLPDPLRGSSLAPFIGIGYRYNFVLVN
jgi:hypothetical protein